MQRQMRILVWLEDSFKGKSKNIYSIPEVTIFWCLFLRCEYVHTQASRHWFSQKYYSITLTVLQCFPHDNKLWVFLYIIKYYSLIF